MHRQARRPVDDQHQPVAVKYARLDLVGRQFWNIHRWSRLSFASRNR